MKNIYSPFALAALVLSQVAYAETARKIPATYCKPEAAISKAVESCEGNDAFIEQGETCLDKLDAEVNSATATMSALFSPDANAAQAAKLDSANQDYKAASASLAYLISLNELALKELDGYLGALVMPEDSDEEEVTNGDPQKYAMSVSCFGESTRSLQSVKADFEEQLKELRDTKATTDTAGAKADLARKAIGGGSVAAPAAPATPAAQKAATPVPSGTASKSGSDITGLHEDAAKQPQK